MRLDEGLKEIGIASVEELNAAGEHGIYQTMVPIAQAAFVRHKREHIHGHVCVYMCMYVGAGGDNINTWRPQKPLITGLSMQCLFTRFRIQPLSRGSGSGLPLLREKLEKTTVAPLLDFLDLQLLILENGSNNINYLMGLF